MSHQPEKKTLLSPVPGDFPEQSEPYHEATSQGEDERDGSSETGSDDSQGKTTGSHPYKRPRPCPVCQKLFPSSSKLERHMRVHTGEKPYVCPQCSARFTQKSSLKTHMRKHSEAKKYTCPSCLLPNLDLDVLRAHDKYHKSVTKSQREGYTPWPIPPPMPPQLFAMFMPAISVPSMLPTSNIGIFPMTMPFMSPLYVSPPRPSSDPVDTSPDHQVHSDRPKQHADTIDCAEDPDQAYLHPEPSQQYGSHHVQSVSHHQQSSPQAMQFHGQPQTQNVPVAAKISLSAHSQVDDIAEISYHALYQNVPRAGDRKTMQEPGEGLTASSFEYSHDTVISNLEMSGVHRHKSSIEENTSPQQGSPLKDIDNEPAPRDSGSY